MELNKITQANCVEFMEEIENNTIDLVVTSPPYYNLREYSQWNSYESYLDDIDRWFHHLGRVVKPGRHICWNIQRIIPDKRDKMRWHWPLSADTIHIAYDHGFMLDQTIIWNKNTSNQRMF